MTGEASRPTKGERTARRILDAAEGLFASRGYRGTTLREVARAADLREPSLYNHFASKDDLYAAVLTRGLDPMLDRMDAVLADGAEEERRRLPELMLAYLTDHPDVARILVREGVAWQAGPHPAFRRWMERLVAGGLEVVAGTGPGDRAIEMLALLHLVTSYVALAPAFGELLGVDLLAEPARGRQVALLRELADRAEREGRGP